MIKNKEAVQGNGLIEKERSNIKDPLVSIIIPLYNEENSIKEVINRIPDKYRYEIIVVDDGSTDNSVKKVQEIDKNIIILKHKNNSGYGAAILTGFRHATGDIMITLDSDGQHKSEEVPNLVEPILNNEADIVVGSRYLSENNYYTPLYTRIGEYFIAWCLFILFGQKVEDNQNGFRAFRKETVQIFLRRMRFTGMGFTTELLFRSSLSGYKIIEIAMTPKPRLHGSSYVKIPIILCSVVACVFLHLIKLFLKKTNLQKILDKVLD